MDLEKNESFIFLFMPFLTLSSFPDCKLSYIKGRYCYVQNQQALYPQQNHIRNSIVESRSCMMWGIKLKRWVALDGFLNLVTHRWISETLGTPWNALYRNFGGRAVGLCLFKCSKEFRLPLPKKKVKPFLLEPHLLLSCLCWIKERRNVKAVRQWANGLRPVSCPSFFLLIEPWFCSGWPWAWPERMTRDIAKPIKTIPSSSIRPSTSQPPFQGGYHQHVFHFLPVRCKRKDAGELLRTFCFLYRWESSGWLSPFSFLLAVNLHVMVGTAAAIL